MSHLFMTLRHYFVQKGQGLLIFPPVLRTTQCQQRNVLATGLPIKDVKLWRCVLQSFVNRNSHYLTKNNCFYSRDRKINSSILIGAIRKQSASQYVVRLRHSRTDRGNDSWQSGNVTPNLSPLSAAIHKTFIPYQQKFYHKSSEDTTSVMCLFINRFLLNQIVN